MSVCTSVLKLRTLFSNSIKEKRMIGLDNKVENKNNKMNLS